MQTIYVFGLDLNGNENFHQIKQGGFRSGDSFDFTGVDNADILQALSELTGQDLVGFTVSRFEDTITVQRAASFG